MNEKNAADLFIGVILAIGLLIYFIFADPFLLWLMFPVLFLIIIVWTSGTSHRDEYFKAKKTLMLTVATVGFMALAAYYFKDVDFTFFAYNQNGYVLFAALLVCCSLFMGWFTKKTIPISFLKDDDRLVQETMYEDYDFQTLGDTYAYRYSKFIDSNRKKLSPAKVLEAQGDLTPLELTTHDIEMEAINDKDELKFYYEKVIYDMYNDLLQGGKNQNKMLEQYGYNLTIIHGIKSQAHFKEVLKEHSLLYYKIFCFLEDDMNKDFISIKLRWKNLYADNLHCLEMCLISSILMVRQYMNFPVGDMAKYVKNTKDKNFLGCFSSLPADFANVNSTSVSASGIAYYYIYYKIHLDWFLKDTQGVEERWLV